jgi:hypothetical protein
MSQHRIPWLFIHLWCVGQVVRLENLWLQYGAGVLRTPKSVLRCPSANIPSGLTAWNYFWVKGIENTWIHWHWSTSPLGWGRSQPPLKAKTFEKRVSKLELLLARREWWKACCRGSQGSRSQCKVSNEEKWSFKINEEEFKICSTLDFPSPGASAVRPDSSWNGSTSVPPFTQTLSWVEVISWSKSNFPLDLFYKTPPPHFSVAWI